MNVAAKTRPKESRVEGVVFEEFVLSKDQQALTRTRAICGGKARKMAGSKGEATLCRL